MQDPLWSVRAGQADRTQGSTRWQLRLTPRSMIRSAGTVSANARAARLPTPSAESRALPVSQWSASAAALSLPYSDVSDRITILSELRYLSSVPVVLNLLSSEQLAWDPSHFSLCIMTVFAEESYNRNFREWGAPHHRLIHKKSHA